MRKSLPAPAALLCVLSGLLVVGSARVASANGVLSVSDAIVDPVLTFAALESPAEAPDQLYGLTSNQLLNELEAEASDASSGCNCQGGSACNCGGGSVLAGLTGVLAHSEPDFHNFISPMTNPVFFEDPRTLTEARAIFFHHTVPLPAGGGSLQLYAVQLRAALNERLSIIATKAWFITSSHPLIDDGWADIMAGLKYNLYSDVCNQRLLSGGLAYELPVGSHRTLQGQGDGEFHLFLTGAARMSDHVQWISGSGFRLPVDGSAGSQMWYWSNHFDYQLPRRVYVFTEFNWFHWMRSGKGGIPGLEGGDVFNFGSTGVAGQDIVTSAIGLKLKPTDLVEAGVAFEFPISGRRGVMDNRLTADLILRY
ncbi:MAG: hypothetical protein O3C40_17905 [Planctomycetota bacterium]|nr:hypothetical protein [Planctomycetota bacterium]